ncbi:unnamed protein product [Bursaphelenchus okinawaensis]|uniref:protein-serine/threonine phosphatase n=1 Tax=Bursaphelenchus okinawaensis TaxID=465554 RepID=A0A811KHG7_9BILA|nr:unnamed protein product [Bursaphelenchus okinawaensis]CAG9103375.1 unnamed protein product [Bursaphelenchus okinawaensis]
MGQTLSEPVTTKESSVCQSKLYNVASCAMQGWRISMEDSHTQLLSCPDDEKAAFFAVYDGHGGARVAQFAGMHLHKRVVGNEDFAKGDIASAIRNGFLKIDEDLRNDEETKEQMSGTTAVTVLIKDGKIYCGNAGDSRAVLCEQGKAIPLSFDHKPTNDEETQRIVAAGGWVEAGRVNGNLALSRALGDFIFKTGEHIKPEEQVVTAYPDVVEVELTRDHEFIVLACDGVWDVLTNEQVVWFVRNRLASGVTPDKICEELLNRCLAPDCEMTGVGCDNMTVVLVCLLQGDTPEEYLERVKRKSIVDEHEFGELYQKPPGGSMPNSEAELLKSIQQQITMQLIGRMDDYGLDDAGDSHSHESDDIQEIDDEDTDKKEEKSEEEEKKSKEDFVTPSQSPESVEDKSSAQTLGDDAPPSEFMVPAAAIKDDTKKE